MQDTGLTHFEYHKAFGPQFFSKTPQLMQTLPIDHWPLIEQPRLLMDLLLRHVAR